MKQTLEQNGPWLVPVIGAIGVLVTFLTAGPFWAFLGLYVALALALLAALNSLRIARAETGAPPADVAEASSAEPTSEIEDRRPAGLSQVESDDSPHGATVTSPDKTEQDDPVVTALLAALEHDAPGVSAAMDPWISASESNEQTMYRKGLKLRLLSRAGKTDAISELRALADANPSGSALARQFAGALDDLGEHAIAAAELAARVSAAPEEDQAPLLLEEARIRRKLGEHDAAVAIVMALLEQPVSREDKARAFEELGQSLLELGRDDEAFGAMERSLELNPTNSTLRFNLAYAYGSANLRELALVHYEVLIDAQADSAAFALNNLGVELRRLNLNYSAVEHMRRSSEKGESLAAGNLAIDLADQGFLVEAREWIAAGQSSVPIHPRVAVAAQKAAEIPKEEITRIEDLRRRGSAMRQVIRQMKFIDSPELPTGEWVWGSKVFVFVPDGSSCKGSSGEGAQQWTIEVTVGNRMLALAVWQESSRYSIRRGVAVPMTDTVQGYLRDPEPSGTTSAFVMTRVGDDWDSPF